MPLIKHLIDAAKGKHPLGVARSGHWPTVRKEHLALHPTCEVCGGSGNLEVHHRRPFHLHPELELDPANLVTLCEADPLLNCHRIFGHLDNFRGWNPDVIEDAKAWKEKFAANQTRIHQKPE
jgi:5-methylcytosine-specific restriction protein A